jgi:C_GCAxxG_C_C family probable redox protein
MSVDRKLIEEVGNTAYEYEKVYHGCSQCVLKALQERIDLGDGLAFKAASALAGGVGRAGDTCGALLGGVMAIGLAFGRDKLEVSSDSLQYTQAQAYAGEFVQRFKGALGSTTCRDIQKSIFGRSFDMTKPEEREQFQAAGAYEKCPEVARQAALLAAEIILRERITRKNAN